jgi:DNA (cytosine-5)-methyltransferase 1
MPRTPIHVVSLFCGPGGMDLGFRRHGFIPILALDDNQSAVETYNRNHKGKIATKTNIRKVSDTEIIKLVREASNGISPRGVIGGPPCQSFSRGNVNKKRHDPRAGLGQEYARVLKALNNAFQIDFFVFENVTGLKRAKHKRRMNLIFEALKGAGFNLFEQELDASGFGVPQTRRRLFIVGINSAKFPSISFVFPTHTTLSPLTVRATLGKIPPPTFFRKNLDRRKIPVHPNHWAMNPRSTKFSTGQGFNGRSFRKLEWNKPSWTVAYGNREVHVHPNGTRRLSVFEAMLLQGFPRTYELRGTLSDQFSQVSDAVPPPLAAAIAKAVRQAVCKPVERTRPTTSKRRSARPPMRESDH